MNAVCIFVFCKAIFLDALLFKSYGARYLSRPRFAEQRFLSGIETDFAYFMREIRLLHRMKYIKGV